MIEQNSLLAVHLIFHKCCEFYGLGLLDELVRVVVFCVYCTSAQMLFSVLCRWTSRKPAGPSARSARSTSPTKLPSTRRGRILFMYRVNMFVLYLRDALVSNVKECVYKTLTCDLSKTCFVSDIKSLWARKNVPVAKYKQLKVYFSVDLIKSVEQIAPNLTASP